MRQALLLVLTLSLTCSESASQPAAKEDQRVAKAVEVFYRTQMERPHSGLLSAAELKQIKPLLSAKLYSRYERAVRAREDWARANPDDPARRIFNKPPCCEGGNYFESLAEWPDVRSNSGDDPVGHFEVRGAERQRDGSWKVSLHFWYETTPRVEWTDVVVAVEEHGEFVVHDVIFPGGPFNRDGRLSELLNGCEEQSRVVESK
jgi:hypothetical protein